MDGVWVYVLDAAGGFEFCLGSDGTASYIVMSSNHEEESGRYFRLDRLYFVIFFNFAENTKKRTASNTKIGTTINAKNNT